MQYSFEKTLIVLNAEGIIQTAYEQYSETDQAIYGYAKKIGLILEQRKAIIVDIFFNEKYWLPLSGIMAGLSSCPFNVSDYKMSETVLLSPHEIPLMLDVMIDDIGLALMGKSQLFHAAGKFEPEFAEKFSAPGFNFKRLKSGEITVAEISDFKIVY